MEIDVDILVLINVNGIAAIPGVCSVPVGSPSISELGTGGNGNGRRYSTTVIAVFVEQVCRRPSSMSFNVIPIFFVSK
jgi:hypothetical protein